MVFRRYFLLLLLSHIIGDFYFQTEEMARQKKENADWVYIHCFCYWLALMIVSLPMISRKVVIFGCIASMAHLTIDVMKYHYVHLVRADAEITVNEDKKIFILDQVLHILCLIVIAYFFTVTGGGISVGIHVNRFFSVIGLPKMECLSWITALLLINKPANIAISRMLMVYRPDDKDAERKRVNNAGRLIGSLERMIMLIFISIGQYSAIGLVLTAKSIARYDKIAKDPEFAEYYLLGTLLSTAAAIIASFLL